MNTTSGVVLGKSDPTPTRSGVWKQNGNTTHASRPRGNTGDAHHTYTTNLETKHD